MGRGSFTKIIKGRGAKVECYRLWGGAMYLMLGGSGGMLPQGI